jgi:hypothetical protein
MQAKDIKRLVIKQLKQRFPHWRRLTRKQKKALAEQVLKEAASDSSSEGWKSVCPNELTGTPATPKGIISLDKMGAFVENKTRGIINLTKVQPQKHLQGDEELREIDAMLDDRVLNALLSYEGYTPTKRSMFPRQCFRAEILKSLRYSEWSYRKYCKLISDLKNKTERSFIHMSLVSKVRMDHSYLSQFRSGLTFSQMVNLSVYVIYLLLQSGKISHPVSVCGVDSTELPVCCNPMPLTTLEIGKKKIKIYSELDADCGKRRKKRDKSEYFVGYRLHTIVAIDPETHQTYPLISLTAPGNHHDSLFLPQLVSLSRAMGLDIKVITADEAYADVEQLESIQQEYGVTVITTPDGHVKIPDHVDEKGVAVYMTGTCDIPMSYIGRTETGHEFKCSDEEHECPLSDICLKYREIPLDARLFGQIPDQVKGVDDIRNIRKHAERPFNLLKNREGLAHQKLTSQQGIMASATFAQITTILLEIVGTRRTKKKEEAYQQISLGT